MIWALERVDSTPSPGPSRPDPTSRTQQTGPHLPDPADQTQPPRPSRPDPTSQTQQTRPRLPDPADQTPSPTRQPAAEAGGVSGPLFASVYDRRGGDGLFIGAGSTDGAEDGSGRLRAADVGVDADRRRPRAHPARRLEPPPSTDAPFAHGGPAEITAEAGENYHHSRQPARYSVSRQVMADGIRQPQGNKTGCCLKSHTYEV